MQATPIHNWIPYQLSYSLQDEWMVKWLDLGNERMIQPFFDDTIQLCRSKQRQRSRLESLSTAAFLEDACKDLPALAPAAFIFHVSRCGSTLLSQAFSTPEEHIVIAEAPLLDEILRVAEQQPDIPATTRENWFRQALQLMGQLRNGKETTYIIKLDSWHIHFYDVLRSWFPQTPFFFLYRRPDEVIASHDKQRGIHSVPGMVNPVLLKTNEPAFYGSDFNGYTAQVLEQYYLALQDIHGQQHACNRFFDYADGVREMAAAFSAFTGIAIKDMEQLHTRLGYHSKSAQMTFAPEDHSNRQRFFFAGCQDAYAQLSTLLLQTQPIDHMREG
ncbi:hypothetical protein F0L74_17745 [Chitinophaga agrisoli]|uniref:Sulfotransferase family protein n=1 Tax=Chitinophaga agrisoli TaxID=2607653 RepID=A0A5B2VSY5_9BACT|nr:hypothetical protein [Chitinophaga agrisoli]KAA2241718.1 hypothetical protein F0L74_17745 [Chitinophaga agrisoli]